MRKIDQLEWVRAVPHQETYSRLDAEHPLEWHAGHSATGEKILLLIAPSDPGPVPSSRGITVARGLRADSRWALTFALSDPLMHDIFMRLCADLVQSTKRCTDPHSGVRTAVRRYRLWMAMLERQAGGLLTLSQQRGLMGEILFLRQKLREGMDAREAVEGWVGPSHASQDFFYSDGWYEIKVVSPSAATVDIASLDQLGAPLPGTLIVYFIEAAAPREPGATTLGEMASQLAEAVELGGPAAGELLADKLLESGYSDCEEYRQQWARAVGGRAFSIRPGFPRITRDMVPAAIASVHYSISLPAIDALATDDYNAY